MEEFIHSNIRKWISVPKVSHEERRIIKNKLYKSDLKKSITLF